jgi:hypothetical protein
MSTDPAVPKSPTDAIAPGPPKSPPSDAIVPRLPWETPKTTPAAPSKPATKTPPQHHDGFRELIETIVFVVVLVLILKTFLAEAFVIPTGSMATTLLGYHREVTCEQCGYRFLVNVSQEADPGERQRPQEVTGCYCENCEFYNDFRPRLQPPGFK